MYKLEGRTTMYAINQLNQQPLQKPPSNPDPEQPGSPLPALIKHFLKTLKSLNKNTTIQTLVCESDSSSTTFSDR